MGQGKWEVRSELSHHLLEPACGRRFQFPVVENAEELERFADSKLQQVVGSSAYENG